MKKIAFFTLGLKKGGAERVVANLSNSFVREHTVFLILVDEKIEYNIDPKVIVKKLAPIGDKNNGLLKLLLIPYYCFYLIRFLKKEKIDILFSFLLRPNFVSCLTKKFLGKKIKVVISERSNPSAQYGGGRIGDKINNYLIKTLYPIADSLTVNSFGCKWALKNDYNIENSIAVIRNPITSEFFRDAYTPIGIKFSFITVGRIDEGKNHIIIIKAIEELVRGGLKEISLKIIGEGPLKSKLIDYCTEKHLTSYVSFLGHQDNIDTFLKQANCFVFSSKREGFPNVILEAMAAKLPIVSTDCPFGPREILANADVLPQNNMNDIEVYSNGILVPLNNPIVFSEAMQHVMKNYSYFTEKFDIQVLDQYLINNIITDYKKMFFGNYEA